MPADFTAFFAAGAGAAAALVGLLFVAVSISPERNVGPGAPLERQVVAEGAFTALTNASFVCLGALVPTFGVGVIAVTAGAVALWHTITTGWRMLRASGGLVAVARGVFFVGSSLVLYGLECIYALQVLGAFGRPQPDAVYSIAYMLLFILAIGLLRAWQLLGAPRRGLFGWLIPLHPEDTSPKGPATPRGRL